MSGGSYNYASDVSDLDDVVSKRFDLDAMCDRLYGRSDVEMEDAAADLEGLLTYVDRVIKRVEARLRRLQPVLHAVEWHDSGDWGIERVHAALAIYRSETQPEHELSPHPRPLIEVFDEAHLEEPLTGKVMFLWVEDMAAADAIQHMREVHRLTTRQMGQDLRQVYAEHTRRHPIEGHCHVKGGHRTTTIEPMIGMLDDMAAMRHMRIAHAHDYVLGPINSREGLERRHAEFHEGHQGLNHEHRRH